MHSSHKPEIAKELVHAATMLVVKDLDRAVSFYTEYLGFQIKEQDSGIALLILGQVRLYLVLTSPPTPDKPTISLSFLNKKGQTNVNLVFRVKSCQTVYRKLVDQGLTFLAPPHQPPWGGWRCFTLDPDGYLVEIEEYSEK
jgi:catechol 2,3-dioxygenase-like lactoylglutathione lyase family enzyme